MISKKRLFFSFLIGSAIGSIIVLLYAPKPGKKLRNDLRMKTKELINAGKKKTIDMWNETKEKTESTLGKANDFLNSGVEKIKKSSENKLTEKKPDVIRDDK